MSVDLEYLKLVEKIIKEGILRGDSSRNERRQCIFGHTIELDVSRSFPLLQIKETDFKNICVELLWFLKGDTNIQYLLKHGCNIWNKDAYQHYLKYGGEFEDMDIKTFINTVKAGKTEMSGTYKLGDLGPIYGKQWREFGTPPASPGKIREVDQIARVLRLLTKDPSSTSMVVSAWNPTVLNNVALPSCHHGFQLNCDVINGVKYIDLVWQQRSVDVGLGLPYNIASYALLLNIFCIIVGATPRKLVGQLANCHLYEAHIGPMKDLLDTKPEPNETILTFVNTMQNMKFVQLHREMMKDAPLYDRPSTTSLFMLFEPENFSVVNYKPKPRIKLEMYEKIK